MTILIIKKTLKNGDIAELCNTASSSHAKRKTITDVTGLHTREKKSCIDDVKINDSNVILDSEIVIFPPSQTKILPLSDPDLQCSSFSSPVLQDESIPSPIVNVQSSNVKVTNKESLLSTTSKYLHGWSTRDYRGQRALMKSAYSPLQTSISNYFDPLSISTFIDNEDILRTEINRICRNEKTKSVAAIMKMLKRMLHVHQNMQTGTMKQSKKLLARFFVSLVKVVMTFYSLILEVLCRLYHVYRGQYQSCLSENGYDLKQYFITQNAYTWIELNGHMLLNVICNVIRGVFPSQALRIWLTGSQGCEQMFRLLRSMTPIFLTIINFTLRGMLERIHKINYLFNMESDNEIQFPRAKRRLLHLNEESDATFAIPSVEERTSSLMEAKNEAINICRSCCMELEN